jgi:hypothetical protein
MAGAVKVFVSDLAEAGASRDVKLDGGAVIATCPLNVDQFTPSLASTCGASERDYCHAPRFRDKTVQ